MRRTVLEHGLQLMVRAGLVEVHLTDEGLCFQASEEAAPFVQLIRSAYIDQLRDVASWVVQRVGDQPPASIRTELSRITRQWADELDTGELIDAGKPGIQREVSTH